MNQYSSDDSSNKNSTNDKLESIETTSEEKINELDQIVNQLIEDQNKFAKYNPIEQRDKTRSEIALFFVRSYFILIGLTFLTILIYNLIIAWFKLQTETLSIKDILLVITGVIGSPLGFVLGYYFKGQEEKNS